MNENTNKTAPTATVDAAKLDAKTKYDLLLYDFIQDDFYKNPWSNKIQFSKFTDMDNSGFVNYCVLARTNLYNISIIKRKIDCLPDNNSFMPALYSCVIMNKHYIAVDRPDDIVSKMLYNLFTSGKQK